MNQVRTIIASSAMTYQQKLYKLAMEAEATLPPPQYPAAARQHIRAGVICEMSEGNAPYRPRYILPDYAVLMRRGSAFLGLDPPRTLAEALNALTIIYRHVPSITSFPVFLGNLDELLEPFVRRIPRAAAAAAIRGFLLHLDRTLTDSFVHANIGPRATRTGELILAAERELQNAVPNLSLKYSPQLTPRAFALDAVRTGLAVSKPYFVNDDLLRDTYPGGYGVASCYNTLPLGGGSFTLVRLNLAALARRNRGRNVARFLDRELPAAVAAMGAVIEARLRFLVEESGFFTRNFLVEEGFIARDRFTAMFGIYGLAECVNHLLNARAPRDRYGRGAAARSLGLAIMTLLRDEVARLRSRHCAITGHRYVLHAQSGITTDVGVTAGVRIPSGEEPPEIIDHIRHTAPFHDFFPAGVSDIFLFEKTARRNPAHVLDIAAGAMAAGLRLFAFGCSDSDLVRITGFLVKRSAIAQAKRGRPVLHGTVALSVDSFRSAALLNRIVR
ncbi:MAG TPA: YjjI family glycine radical enzyme [bacterium]|nr:YjjI family glycine radical enzyme [bacterium]